MDPERLVRVQGRADRLWILGDQLQVAERGEQRDHEREQERQPHRAAHLGRDLAGERVHPGAEDVADHEEQQQPGSDDPLEGGLVAVERAEPVFPRPP
nr:hypothetical protein GCM10020092_054940 [Actinoplanes digitatis]